MTIGNFASDNSKKSCELVRTCVQEFQVISCRNVCFLSWELHASKLSDVLVDENVFRVQGTRERKKAVQQKWSDFQAERGCHERVIVVVVDMT